MKWEATTSALGTYSGLHGLAPLHILRHVKAHPYRTGMTREETNAAYGPATVAIERLLLDYDATE